MNRTKKNSKRHGKWEITSCGNNIIIRKEKEHGLQECSKGVLESIGGASNIVSAAHCATRLRLVIADNSRCSKAALEEVEGVKGVFEAAGQIQIIFGTGNGQQGF